MSPAPIRSRAIGWAAWRLTSRACAERDAWSSHAARATGRPGRRRARRRLRRSTSRTPSSSRRPSIDAMLKRSMAAIQACRRLQISVSPTSVFMSVISPRRTISRASRNRNVRGSMSSSSSTCAASSGSPGRRRGRRSFPRRSSRASEQRASRTTVAGTRPISSWHSRVAAAFGRLSLVDAAGRQLPQERVHRVAVLPDQDHVARLGHRDEHDRLRGCRTTSTVTSRPFGIRTVSRSIAKTLPLKTRSWRDVVRR